MHIKKVARFKNEVAKETKFPKERLTLLLCCNALGEKLKPVVVGKSNNSRAFKKDIFQLLMKAIHLRG